MSSRSDEKVYYQHWAKPAWAIGGTALFVGGAALGQPPWLILGAMVAWFVVIVLSMVGQTTVVAVANFLREDMSAAERAEWENTPLRGKASLLVLTYVYAFKLQILRRPAER